MKRVSHGKKQKKSFLQYIGLKKNVFPFLIFSLFFLFTIRIFYAQKNSLQPIQTSNSVNSNSLANKSNSFDTGMSAQKLHYELGKFIFEPTTEYYLPDVPMRGQEMVLAEVKSNPLSLQDDSLNDFECRKIGNYFTLALRNAEAGDTYVSVTSFDTESVSFSSQDAKIFFDTYIESLKKDLPRYTNSDVIQNELITYSQYRVLAFPQTSCSGGWSFPIYVQKVESGVFDSVYYLERDVGNGDHTGLPLRELIINQGDHWFIAAELQQPDEITKSIPWDDCYGKKQEISGETQLECAYRLITEYRDHEKNIKWIDRVLSAVSLSESQ